MQLIQTKKINQRYGSRQDIGNIFGYKDPTKLLKGFRDVADEWEHYFKPYTPYIKNKGMDTLYSIVCFALYLEHKDLIESGTRSINFSNELKRLKEIYEE